MCRCKATLFCTMLLFMCSKALGSPGPLVDVRIGEESNPDPGVHRLDIVEPGWSEHESEGESIHGPDSYLEEISADNAMDTGGIPHDANELRLGSRLKEP